MSYDKYFVPKVLGQIFPRTLVSCYSDLIITNLAYSFFFAGQDGAGQSSSSYLDVVVTQGYYSYYHKKKRKKTNKAVMLPKRAIKLYFFSKVINT